MRPWRVRLAVRRSRVQWAFLAVVLAVSTLAATLLATLYLLSVATETFAARAALNEVEDQDVSVTFRITPDGSLDAILAGSDAAAEQMFGSVPYTRIVTTESKWLAVPRENRQIALAYLASTDALADRVSIVSGKEPQARGGGPVQVIVPQQLLDNLDIQVGATLTMAPFSSRNDKVDYVIVGTYVATDLDDPVWLGDRFRGTGYSATTLIPFTDGRGITDGFGPLYTVQADVEAAPLESVTVTYTPDFSNTSLSQVTDVVNSTADLDLIATRSIGGVAERVTVASRVQETLGGVVGSLAVTRSSVLVTGLLLLVLAVAALSQTARLMAERRYAEQHLMIARGGSGRQIFRLGFIEAIALGVLTAVIAAPLARLTYLTLARAPVMQDAGMNVDPGIPPLTWVVTGIVGFILVLVLVAPLMRRQTSFVDAEQARARPGKRAAFQRSGLDLAVLVLAILAYWQLKNYKSPMLATGGVARVDPLLAAGPALALLAGALVAVRLIPPASKLLEGLAARGRKAVLPLAAWEVGRRSARAISAILLLTLAVSIGTFAVTFLTSWHQSQDDQALYQHPPDVIVSNLEAPVLAQHGLVDAGGYAQSVSPVIHQNVLLAGSDDFSHRRSDFSGRPFALRATDDAGLQTYSGGRLEEVGGSRIPQTLAGTAPSETNPIEIPGLPGKLRMTAAATMSRDIGEVSLTLRAVVRDSTGMYQTIEMNGPAVDGTDYVLTGSLVDVADLANVTAPLYLVGIQAQWVSLGLNTNDPNFDVTQPVTLTLSLDNIEAVAPLYSEPLFDVPIPEVVMPLAIPTNLNWIGTGNGVGIDSLDPVDDQIHARVKTSPGTLANRVVNLAITASDTVSPVPLVVTGSVLDELALEVGDAVELQVESNIVSAYIAQRVPIVTGDTVGNATVVANISALQMGVIQSGGRTVTPSQWWASVADDDLDAYRAALPKDATMTAQSWLAEDLKNDSLRVAIQAALWLVAGAAVALAALGFAVHAIVTVRAREIELAQMRAIGVLRGQLLRVVSAENALLSALALVFGLGLGIALSFLVAPLVSVGADGKPPLPPVIVQIPWAALGVLVGEVALVLAVSIVIVGFMLRRINPAQMLRLGDER